MKRGIIRVVSMGSMLWIGIVGISLTPRVGLCHEKEGGASPSQLAQTECMHTYREPGCVGGKECVRRESIPCKAREPSLQRKIYEGVKEGTEGLREGLGEYFGEEAGEPEPRGTHFGVRG